MWRCLGRLRSLLGIRLCQWGGTSALIERIMMNSYICSGLGTVWRTLEQHLRWCLTWRCWWREYRPKSSTRRVCDRKILLDDKEGSSNPHFCLLLSCSYSILWMFGVRRLSFAWAQGSQGSVRCRKNKVTFSHEQQRRGGYLEWQQAFHLC